MSHGAVGSADSAIDIGQSRKIERAAGAGNIRLDHCLGGAGAPHDTGIKIGCGAVQIGAVILGVVKETVVTCQKRCLGGSIKSFACQMSSFAGKDMDRRGGRVATGHLRRDDRAGAGEHAS